ncbi:hypothetical protein QUA40_00010 [Microcoleus sp. Pol11C3]|uniref:hypothetical protein n=1 Tax=Microcoleus sp. Pol11C3 TaxID=3055390 RepID=UPI002FD51FE3
MSTIQVYKYNSEILLGTGQGNINTSDKTATITQWEKSAGLEVKKTYKLISDRKVYPKAECTGVGLPTTFKNVE